MYTSSYFWKDSATLGLESLPCFISLGYPSKLAKKLTTSKIRNFITLYRSPSQNQDDFQAFIDNLEMNLETLAQKKNRFLTLIIGDFNKKSKN